MALRIAILAFAAVTLLFAPSAGFTKKNVGHCPPGLAKKNPPCVPPGQFGKGPDVGNWLPYSNYYVVRNPSRYRLPKLGSGQSYYRDADRFFRINRDTREILELIDAMDAVLN